MGPFNLEQARLMAEEHEFGDQLALAALLDHMMETDTPVFFHRCYSVKNVERVWTLGEPRRVYERPFGPTEHHLHGFALSPHHFTVVDVPAYLIWPNEKWALARGALITSWSANYRVTAQARSFDPEAVPNLAGHYMPCPPGLRQRP